MAAADLGERRLRGIGRHVVARLLPLGEQVVDGPAKLSARVRIFAIGRGRKTDDTDAHSIALAGAVPATCVMGG